MKKILLLTMVSAMGFSAFSQQKANYLNSTEKRAAFMSNDLKAPTMKVKGHEFSSYSKKVNHKTRAAFYTEDFSSGTNTTMPTGWTTGGSVASAIWKWRNVSCVSQYNLGVINSTTAANGWMVYDSDSIGSLLPGAFSGWMQSPVINCTGHATVRLSFEQHFRKFSDSCIIKISTNGGVSWTVYDLPWNNAVTNNTYLPSNSYKTYVNISGVAANQASVLVRFEYYCSVVGGSYNWLVDDLAMSEIDPIDAYVASSSFINSFTANEAFNYAEIPLDLADSMYGYTFVSNFGATALPSIPVSAMYIKDGALLTTANNTYTNLAVGGTDSLLTFTGINPTQKGNYSIAYYCNVPGDAIASNNFDTLSCVINDSIYSSNDGPIPGSFYVHRKAAGGNPEASYSIGTMFELSKSDTITGARIAFSSQTTVGAKVKLSLYHFDAGTTTWEPYLSGDTKSLLASEISTAANIVLCRFALGSEYVGAVLKNVIGPGIYALVVEPDQTNPIHDALILYSNNERVFDRGVADTATNGVGSFGAAGLPFSLGESTPIIWGIFNNKLGTFVGTNNISGGEIAINAFPNPADKEINFEIGLAKNFDKVTINVTNAVGQLVKSVDLGSATVNNLIRTTMNVAELPAGLYIYTIDADGQKQSNKIIIR